MQAEGESERKGEEQDNGVDLTTKKAKSDCRERYRGVPKDKAWKGGKDRESVSSKNMRHRR